MDCLCKNEVSLFSIQPVAVGGYPAHVLLSCLQGMDARVLCASPALCKFMYWHFAVVLHCPLLATSTCSCLVWNTRLQNVNSHPSALSILVFFCSLLDCPKGISPTPIQSLVIPARFYATVCCRLRHYTKA